MICCDQCGEWYHGSCVGVTKNEGKKIAASNQQWMCSVCVEKGPCCIVCHQLLHLVHHKAVLPYLLKTECSIAQEIYRLIL